MLYICEYADKCKVKESDDWFNDLEMCDHCIPHEHNGICDIYCKVDENDIPDGMEVYCVPYGDGKDFIEEKEMEL